MIEIPEAKWAGPVDSEWDIHYNEFELWVNDNYDPKNGSIFGYHISWDDACESEGVFDMFMIQKERERDV
jgi:hypothetical protein